MDVELHEFAPGPAALARAAVELPRRYGARLPGRRSQRRFDVVHAHFGLTAWPALALPARVRALTVHGTDVRHPRTRLATAAVLPLDRPARRVSSAQLAQELPGRAARRRAQVLPCGVDLARFAPLPRGAGARRARAGPRRAATCCSPPTPRAPRSATIARSRSHAPRGVQLLTLGGVEPERVPLWVNAANAVLVPSEREGFGLAVLEALACDVPVLATPVGVHREALDGVAGTLCAPFELARWRAALEPHLRDRDPSVEGRASAEPLLGGRDGGARRRRLARGAAREQPIRLGSAARLESRCSAGPAVRLAWISCGSDNCEHAAPADAPPGAGTAADSPEPAPEQGPPAGAGDAATETPGFRSRGSARRRARFLRKARELAYRDLGGLVFNLHRFGARNDALVLAKLTTLAQIDDELRALEDALRERRPDHRAARGGHHRVCPLRGHPQQRRQLLPELRPCDRPSRRLPADLRTGRLTAAGGAEHLRARPTVASHGERARASPAAAAPASATRAERTQSRAHRRGAKRSNRPRAESAGAAYEDGAGVARARISRRTDGDPPSRRGRDVSVATPAPAGAGGRSSAGQDAPWPATGESCPLCGAPVHAAQDWCLNCGAAARTRLAGPPRWRPIVAAFATVVCLSLGVLAAALIALAGGNDPAPASTRTVPAASVRTGGADEHRVGAAQATTGASSTGASGASTSSGAASSRSAREKLDRLLGSGATGTASASKAKLPAVKLPGGTAPAIKIPKIKVPEIKIPKLTLSRLREVTDDTDVAVVGAGAAGLYAALCAARERARVVLVSATPLAQTASYWAQGGLAATLAADDSFELHLRDTRARGAPWCAARPRRRSCAKRPTASATCRASGFASTPIASGTSRSGSRAATRSDGWSTRAAAPPAGASCANSPRWPRSTPRSGCSRERGRRRCGAGRIAAAACCATTDA